MRGDFLGRYCKIFLHIAVEAHGTRVYILVKIFYTYP